MGRLHTCNINRRRAYRRALGFTIRRCLNRRAARVMVRAFRKHFAGHPIYKNFRLGPPVKADNEFVTTLGWTQSKLQEEFNFVHGTRLASTIVGAAFAAFIEPDRDDGA